VSIDDISKFSCQKLYSSIYEANTREVKIVEIRMGLLSFVWSQGIIYYNQYFV
jgi:hypothetical protein